MSERTRLVNIAWLTSSGWLDGDVQVELGHDRDKPYIEFRWPGAGYVYRMSLPRGVDFELFVREETR